MAAGGWAGRWTPPGTVWGLDGVGVSQPSSSHCPNKSRTWDLSHNEVDLCEDFEGTGREKETWGV